MWPGRPWRYPALPRRLGALVLLLGILSGCGLHVARAGGAEAGTPVFASAASTVSPAHASPGSAVQLAVVFTSATAATNVTLDIEVRDAANAKVFQQAFVNQAFAASQARSVSAIWAVPADAARGTYTVVAGAFSADWATTYGWSDTAATLLVESDATTSSFYVDCADGNDGNSGTDPGQAWATLGRANEASLGPGAALLLKRGCTWTGPLHAAWNGTADQPILISAYGAGSAPLIQNATNQLDVTGSYVTVDGLAFRSDPDHIDPGCNNQTVGYRVGVLFASGANNNTVRNSTFSSLSMGVWADGGSHHNSITANTFNKVNMMFTLTPKSYNSTDDGGGQAILLEGDYNDVGYNTISDSLTCSYDFDTDGAAVEIFGGSHNIIHHNVSVNTDIFSEIARTNSVDNVFAYNIGNGHSAITNHAGSVGTKLYNNVFYSTGGSGDNGIVCEKCSLNALTVKNNIVWSAGPLMTRGAPVDEGYNVYWDGSGSPFLDVAISGTSKIANPGFVNPGVDFRVQGNSPATDLGIVDLTNLGLIADLARQAAMNETSAAGADASKKGHS